MATLVFQFAGQALGTMVGGPLGGMIGRAVGGLAGSVVDQALLGGRTRHVEGPRLDDLQVQASSEGVPIPRLFGRVRVSGQVIWATNFEEEITTHTERAGGKSTATSTSGVRVTEYKYYGNFAVALSEGPVSRIGRVWADGKEIDIGQFTWRFYRGDEEQLPDSLIEAKEGAGNAPAYRGLAYIVFERMPLTNFGNRLPQLAFEVFNAPDDVEGLVKAVNIIPGATEFGYDTKPIRRDAGWGETAAENTHTAAERTDWSVSMDQLQSSCRNVGAASLVVAWFGDDLRCGSCTLKPGVESRGKETKPESWRVGNLTRSSARLVSRVEGKAAFAGTPSDRSVIRAIRDLKERGLEVVFYPFILMDVPPDNALPDPHGGAPGQPAYPWRGRITCDPAPDQMGTPDKTAALTADVDAFFGDAAPGDFFRFANRVFYLGPSEWSLRRMILHYAHLCALAGGVDAFLIASEMVGLTTLRDGPDHYPAVDRLAELAGDVAEILPDAKISYAADWSEYFGHHLQDGSGDAFFHLDPLWMSDAVDFVGIDNYMPLADWRDGQAHLDREAGVRSPYDLDYLKANIAGGEGFDWYYASGADRQLQIRTPITDGAHGKPWVFRNKDLVSWWSNPHYDRPGGVEAASATAWVPEAKPIWFTEIGCPAVDKGANQPNSFNDARSSESALPYFSSGARDDFMQRRYLQAFHEYWSGEAGTARNPVSAVYGAEMVPPERMFIWAWDARPFPTFPYRADVWADGPNYEAGHWLNGRMGAASLGALVSAIIDSGGGVAHDTSALEGVIDGYLIDRPMSARNALEPLSLAFSFDAVESGGRIRFRHRGAGPVIALGEGDLVEEAADQPLVRVTRAQESELPASVRLSYVDSLVDYRKAAVETRRLVGHSIRQSSADLPAVISQSLAQARAEVWLQDVWAGRERARFALPRGHMALEPGDTVALGLGGRERLLRIESVADGMARRVEAVSLDPGVYEAVAGPHRAARPQMPPVYGKPVLEFLDLPLMTGEETPHAGYFAGFAKPWPGGLAIARSASGSGFEHNRTLDAPATMGETLDALAPGPTGRWHRGGAVRVKLFSGALSSVDPLQLFGGANVAALRGVGGGWEVFQFRGAELVGPNTYRLSGLLRGQSGSEAAMAAEHPAGTRFVLLNGAVMQAAMALDEVGLAFTYRYGPANRDIGDEAFAQDVHAFAGTGLKPLSPVHVRWMRDPVAGHVSLSWIRRTRRGGDSWDQLDVPLGEDAEAYEVDILDGADAVVRTIATATPDAVYTAGDQMADFTTIPASFDVVVYQISATYGRGTGRRTTIDG
ncbi:glycoside hydrolase/phage tail family protein [Kaustia mangrovi]|uniref:Glycoside hydrolase/phage tail family protein n=1 Tax=Kaustia mangrovi TaxID=2593653 RepID=A0A7S8HAZ3_9HYPH|nr:glycoside hydrolase/phage tail family protein [Kaustia mangrovi]QPC41986.1 glycoside hydrolase/phage tail family protein [Kaustia mangrovi]